jgi:hypothetical protein
MRMAMLSSRARLAMVPTCIVADKPLRPLMASLGTPQSGARRGNSKNSSTMTGAPNRVIEPAMRAACSKGGLPTGIWALTRAVRRPSSAISMAPAVKSDCEKKKLLSIMKKLRKNTTKASRRARSSSVFKASSTTIRVRPASRPSRVLWVNSVAPTVSTSSNQSHQRAGNGRSVTASQPRHSMTAPLSRLHHSGRWLTCGNTTQAITPSMNSVSRLSRGSRRR